MTSAPSATATLTIWLSRRGLIWMEAMAWTEPTASMTTGSDFGDHGRDDDRHRAARIGPAATALGLRPMRPRRRRLWAALAIWMPNRWAISILEKVCRAANRNDDRGHDRQSEHFPFLKLQAPLRLYGTQRNPHRCPRCKKPAGYGGFPANFGGY